MGPGIGGHAEGTPFWSGHQQATRSTFHTNNTLLVYITGTFHDQNLNKVYLLIAQVCGGGTLLFDCAKTIILNIITHIYIGFAWPPMNLLRRIWWMCICRDEAIFFSPYWVSRLTNSFCKCPVYKHFLLWALMLSLERLEIKDWFLGKVLGKAFLIQEKSMVYLCYILVPSHYSIFH